MSAGAALVPNLAEFCSNYGVEYTKASARLAQAWQNAPLQLPNIPWVVVIETFRETVVNFSGSRTFVRREYRFACVESSQVLLRDNKRPARFRRKKYPLTADQWWPSVLLAEAFSFSGAFSSDLADVAFWSLFWPSPVWVDFEPFKSLSPDVAACFETFESFSLPLPPFPSCDLVSALESSPSSKRLP